MRLLCTIPIIGRTPTVRPTLLPLAIVRNGSRLSGIHHGLRRSERARPQGATPSIKLEIRQDPNAPRPYLSPDERRKQRAVARQNPLTYQIRKGKKDITGLHGPSRIRTSKRWADPRDPLGGGSLLKKFRTGQLVEELRELEENKSDHIQHDDFARQLATDQVEDLMSSVKRPNRLRRAKTKSHYEKLRPGQNATQDATDDWSGTGPDSGPHQVRWEKETNAPQEPNRNSDYDRGTSRDGGRWHRPERRPRAEPDMAAVALRGADFAKQASNFNLSETNHGDKTTSREVDSKLERRGSEREDNYKASGRDRPNQDRHDNGSSRPPAREQRSNDSFRAERRSFDRSKDSIDKESTAAETHNEGGDQKEKPKKKYVPPVSIPYTTAASQFIYGTSTVEAALATSRRKLYKLYIQQGVNRNRQEKDQQIAGLAHLKNVPVEWVDEDRVAMLNRMSSSRPHNGYVLEASPLPQLPVKALGEVSGERSWPGFKAELDHQSAEDTAINGTSEFIITEPSTHKPFILLLDEILDPGNLGAIIRTASFMGVSAVITSKSGSASVTPVVLKASAGAAETMTMLSVDSPLDFVKESRANGWRIFAAVPPQSEPSKRQVDMRHVEKTDPLYTDPCILIMGSEGAGLSSKIRRCAHTEVTIPNMSGSKIVDSLNVGVAAALLCSAFVRGRSTMQDSGVKDAGALF